MPITLTCPSCGGQCAVKEDYAGMQVRCPRCPGVITVPMLAPGVPGMESAPVETTPVSPGMPAASGAPPMPPLPAGRAGLVFMENIDRFLAANGITGINRILLFVGVGCLALFLITIMLPWSPSSVTSFVPGIGDVKVELKGGSSLGIATGHGLLYFFLTLGITFLLVFVMLMGWTSLFPYSLWTTSNWAIFVALHLLLHLQAAGWGLILSLIVMLVAAGTLGVVAFSKVFASKA